MKAGRKRSGGASEGSTDACCSQAWCPWHNGGSRDTSDCDGCAGPRRSTRAPEVQPRGGRRGRAAGSVAVSVRKTRRGSVWRDEPDSNHVDFDDLLPPDACIIVEVPRVTTGLNVVHDIVVLMTDHFQELMRRGFLDMNKIAASLRATQRWSEWCGRDCLKNYRAMLGHILKVGGSSIDTVDSRPALECRNDMGMTDRLADESGCYLRVQNRKGETRATVMTSKLMSQMFMSGEELFEWARQTGLIYFAGLYNFIEPESIRDFLFAVGVQSFERATPTRVDMIITCRTRSGDRIRCVATLVRQWKPIPDFLLRLWPLARDDKRQRHMPAVCTAADPPSSWSAIETPVYNSLGKIEEVPPPPPEPRTAALRDRDPKSSTVIIRDGEFASPALSSSQRPHDAPLQLRPPEEPTPPSSPRWSSSLSPSPKWSPNPPPLPQHLLEHLLTSAVEAKNGLAGSIQDQGGGAKPAAVVEPCSSSGDPSLWRRSGVCPDGGHHAQQQQQQQVDPIQHPPQRQHPSPSIHPHVYSPVSPPLRDLLREDMQVTPYHHPLQHHHHHQCPPDLPLKRDTHHHPHQQEPQQQPPIEYDLRHHLTHALLTPTHPPPPHLPSTTHPYATHPPPPSSLDVGQLQPLARASTSEVSLAPLPVTPDATEDLQTGILEVDWDAMAALLTAPSAPLTPAVVPSDSPSAPAFPLLTQPVMEEGVSRVSSTSSEGSGGHPSADGAIDAGGGGVGDDLYGPFHHHQEHQHHHQQQQQPRATAPTTIHSCVQPQQPQQPQQQPRHHVGEGDEQQPQDSAEQAPSAVDDDLTDVPLLNDDTLFNDLSDIAADISLW